MSTHHTPHRWLKVERPPSVDRIEEETRRAYRDVLSTWFDLLLEKLRAGAIIFNSRASVRAIVNGTREDVQAAFDLVFETMWHDGARMGREAAIRQYQFDISFEITRPSVETAIEQHAERASTQVQTRLTNDLTDAMLAAHRDGLSIDEIARHLNETVFPDMKRWQAKRIAQTEVISASNKGNLTAYRDASGISHKRWLATEDHRTRPTHVEADNQIVLIGQPFIVGEEQAMFPGDPSLSPKLRINCRCAVAPVV